MEGIPLLSKSIWRKRLYFVRSLNDLERREESDEKKKASFGWFIDDSKYLKQEELQKLLSTIREQKAQAEKKGRRVAVRDYHIILLALFTGLRVQEIADLKCSDFHLDAEIPYLFVRHGKGGKPRPVFFGNRLKQAIIEYLKWKGQMGEATYPEAPFFLSSNTGTHMTTRALQKVFKRSAVKAGINPEYSIHATRHTYGSHLHKASGNNLRLVQRQLGHSSINTTQVYVGIFEAEMEKALEKLYT